MEKIYKSELMLTEDKVNAVAMQLNLDIEYISDGCGNYRFFFYDKKVPTDAIRTFGKLLGEKKPFMTWVKDEKSVKYREMYILSEEVPPYAQLVELVQLLDGYPAPVFSSKQEERDVLSMLSAETGCNVYIDAGGKYVFKQKE